MTYVTRAGDKLAGGLAAFNVDARGVTAADLGSHKGGFVDCWLQHGAGRVHSVDTSYGTLDWSLRNDPRVVVVERTNAMHWAPEEPVTHVSLDVGWTPQVKVLPQVWRWLEPGGHVISLVKPQYECGDDEREKGIVKPDCLEPVMQRVLAELVTFGFPEGRVIESPIPGGKGNVEYLLYLIKPASTQAQ